MLRLDVRLNMATASAVISLFMIAAPLGGIALADPGKGKGGGQGGGGHGPAQAAPAAPPPRPSMPPPAAMRPPAPPPAAMRPAAPPPQVSRPAPQPHIARPQMQPMPQMQRSQPPPRVAAPSRPAPPRIAAPSRPPPPAVQRAAPPPRAASRPDVARRLQQSVEQRPDRGREQMQGRLSRSDQRELRQLERIAQQQQAAGQRLQRLQARSERGALGRNEQRELRRLQTNEEKQQTAARRLEQLQTRAQDGRLNRNEQRELSRLDRRDQLQKSAAQRLEQLQTASKSGRLDRAGQRELRELERQQRALGLDQRQAVREQAGVRDGRTARVTPQQVAEGRFATGLAARDGSRADLQLRLQAPRVVWRHGLRAGYVPWLSAVYWPYAYSDLFYYTFWPEAYDEGYWAYVYDDFFDGIYFPYGAPHVDYAYAGPYGMLESGVTTGSTAPRQRTPPGRLSQTARAICAQPDEGITAWPIREIEEAVQPTGEQKRLLADLKKAEDAAAEEFRQACPESLPMTPPGRLQTMTMRLQATLDAVKTVRPALEAFYTSLSDEQKARFNEIRPKLKEERTAAAQTQGANTECGGQKAGLSALPIDEIDRMVQPSDAQARALRRLDEATRRAVEILNGACPTSTPETPVGRLEIMQKRLEAMIEAANSVRPALQDLYATLSDEQKAKFNRLGRDSVRGG
jgi:hypothetical protein